jgi:hypothetical protein
VVRDWVDVPLGRLEQYQRHIDPVPPAIGSSLADKTVLAVSM